MKYNLHHLQTLHVNYVDHTMHTTKLLLHRHHLPKPSNVTMKCQDIANTQSQSSMEKDSKDWMNEFNLNLMVRGKSSRSGIKVKKRKNEESLMISLLKVKSITILLKTTLQNRNKHIHLCFYQVEGGSSGENTVQHQHQYKHQIY